MKLPRRLYHELKEHALCEAPRECCGFIATKWDGHEHTAVEVLPVANVAFRPNTTFVTNVRETRAAFQRAVDLECGAVSYHSHPTGMADLSLRDRRQLWYGWHLVIGLGEGGRLALWRIDPEQVLEDRIHVLEDRLCV